MILPAVEAGSDTWNKATSSLTRSLSNGLVRGAAGFRAGVPRFIGSSLGYIRSYNKGPAAAVRAAIDTGKEWGDRYNSSLYDDIASRAASDEKINRSEIDKSVDDPRVGEVGSLLNFTGRNVIPAAAIASGSRAITHL